MRFQPTKTKANFVQNTPAVEMFGAFARKLIGKQPLKSGMSVELQSEEVSKVRDASALHHSAQVPEAVTPDFSRIFGHAIGVQVLKTTALVALGVITLGLSACTAELYGEAQQQDGVTQSRVGGKVVWTMKNKQPVHKQI